MNRGKHLFSIDVYQLFMIFGPYYRFWYYYQISGGFHFSILKFVLLRGSYIKLWRHDFFFDTHIYRLKYWCSIFRNFFFHYKLNLSFIDIFCVVLGFVQEVFMLTRLYWCNVEMIFVFHSEINFQDFAIYWQQRVDSKENSDYRRVKVNAVKPKLLTKPIKTLFLKFRRIRRLSYEQWMPCFSARLLWKSVNIKF